MPAHLTRWYAIKLFERDEKVTAELNLPEGIRKQIWSRPSRTASRRWTTTRSPSSPTSATPTSASWSSTCVRKGKPKGSLTTSDKIDRVVTNRWLALPIFAVVMALVYYICRIQHRRPSSPTLPTTYSSAEWIQAARAAGGLRASAPRTGSRA